MAEQIGGKMLKKIAAVLSMLLFGSVVFAGNQREIFNRTVKHLDMGGLNLQYQNLENLDEQITALLDVCGKAYVHDPMQQMILKNMLAVIRTMNFSDLQAVGSSSKRVASDLYVNKFFLTVNPKASGTLCALPAGKNVRFRYAADLPFNTVFAIGAYLDWNNFFKTFERSFKDKAEINNFSVMFEQLTGVKMQVMAENLAGEFFGAVYKGNKKNELHFIAVIPDRKDVLKTLAVKYFGPALKKYSDGSFSWEIPVAASDFGNGIRVYFVKNQVFIYNSNAPLAQLLNRKGQLRRLSALHPRMFSLLDNINGNSFLVLNFNTGDFAADVTARTYRYVSVCKFMPDGYLVDALSNFNLQNLGEYTPLMEMLPDVHELLGDDEQDKKKAPAPMPL